MATTNYLTIHNVAPSFFVFSRDGKIRIGGTSRQVIGEWEKTNPRKKYGRGYTNTLYCFGLHYKGSWTAYSRKEMVDTLVNVVKRIGIQVEY